MLHIRHATPDDNPGLLLLTRLTPMKGIISLCIDRQPDFFSLLKKRGESFTLVAVEDELVAGVFSASRQTVWLDGQSENVYYVADMKVHPDYRGSTVALRLARKMQVLICQSGTDLIFCTMAEGNDRIMPFFQGRAGLLPFRSVGKFPVLQILPAPFASSLSSVEDFTGAPDDGSLAAFYNSFFKKYQLGHFVQAADLQDARHFVYRENGVVKAAISLLDTSPLKQNVVVGMPFYLRLARTVSKWASKVLPVLPLPGTGEPIRMWNIRFFGCEEGCEEKLAGLVKIARRLAWEQKFFFLSIGLHERDPLMKVFKKFPHIPFTSTGLITSCKGDAGKIERVLDGVPFEDFALV